MALPKHYFDISLILLWYFFDITLKFLWHYFYIILRLHWHYFVFQVVMVCTFKRIQDSYRVYRNHGKPTKMGIVKHDNQRQQRTKGRWKLEKQNDQCRWMGKWLSLFQRSLTTAYFKKLLFEQSYVSVVPNTPSLPPQKQ